jgi:hypothetical protein
MLVRVMLTRSITAKGDAQASAWSLEVLVDEALSC